MRNKILTLTGNKKFYRRLFQKTLSKTTKFLFKKTLFSSDKKKIFTKHNTVGKIDAQRENEFSSFVA